MKLHTQHPIYSDSCSQSNLQCVKNKPQTWHQHNSKNDGHMLFHTLYFMSLIPLQFDWKKATIYHSFEIIAVYNMNQRFASIKIWIHCHTIHWFDDAWCVFNFQLSTSITKCIKVCCTLYISSRFINITAATWNFLQQHIESFVVTWCSSVLHMQTNAKRLGLGLLFYIRFHTNKKYDGGTRKKIRYFHHSRRNSVFKYGPNCITHIFKGLIFIFVKQWIRFSFIVKFYCYHIVIIEIHNIICESDPKSGNMTTRGCFEYDIFLTCTIWLILQNEFIAPKTVRRSNCCIWVFHDEKRKSSFIARCWHYETNYFAVKIQNY